MGSQPDSLKKGVLTKRITHPLDPEYQMPGRFELENINDAFGKKNPVQQAILDKHIARGDNKQFLKSRADTSLEGSKLFAASREAAKEVENLPDNP
jgi:hypothetical protein